MRGAIAFYPAFRIVRSHRERHLAPSIAPLAQDEPRPCRVRSSVCPELQRIGIPADIRALRAESAECLFISATTRYGRGSSQETASRMPNKQAMLSEATPAAMLHACTRGHRYSINEHGFISPLQSCIDRRALELAPTGLLLGIDEPDPPH